MLTDRLHTLLEELEIRVPESRRVLLVDDEPGNLEVLAALLEDDWEVRTACSGSEALDLLAREGAVDLLIADQRMPGMTGIELLSEVARRNPATLRVVLTGYSDLGPMLAAARQGLVYRFLFKPFDPLEIQGIVADALHLKACAAALLELVTSLELHREALVASTEELRQAREKLRAEERLDTLGRIVADLAVELQTRSTSLSMLLSLIRQTETDACVQADAEDVWAGLGALRELLAQVRDYTRITTSPAVLAPIRPRALLARSVELFLMEELGHRCPITGALEDGTGTLVVDAGRLQQAILALLRNAVRASDEGQPITLSIGTGAGGSVSIEVRDGGHGMTEEELRRAGEPFYSGDPTPGLGLGLEIARLAAEAHCGTLELTSDPDRGTTARLSLPPTVREVPRGH